MLAELSGRPLVRHAVERILESRVDQVIVVVPPGIPLVRDALRGLEVFCVESVDAATGMSASLAAGVRALPVDTEAVVVALGDQPEVSPDVVDRVIDAWRTTGKPIVVPVYAGIRGHPVLFAREVFEELRTVRGDQGGREVIARDPGRVAEVRVDGAVPVDVDVREDVARVNLGSRSSHKRDEP
jgi:molybdenum cofactor cytidylyltransferase